MSTVEAHVSSCARCQAMLGAFARGTPDTQSTAGSQSTVRWWRWWLAPIAAGAAAVTLWMVVPEQQELATRPPQPPAAAAIEAPGAAQTKPASETPVPAPAAPSARDANTARPANQERQRAEARRADREQQELKDAAAATQQAASSLPERPSLSAPPAAPLPQAAAGVREEVAAPAIAALQKSARQNFAAADIVSPNPASRWRVAELGVERSEDGGRTWTLVLLLDGPALTVGTSPARTVAWLAGRSGVVLVTNDGATFARVDLPEAIDIASITASDARTAIVVTVDGRRFQTNDSGRTWRRIPA
jgi:hypothetical protein